MKTVFPVIITTLISFSSPSALAQRYLSPVFDEVETLTDIAYGANYTVVTVPITGHSTLQELKMDVYLPVGDTENNRPLALFFHGGNFLPIAANMLTTGTRSDSLAVEVCTQLAKMGYVAASVDYRLGWNPLLPNAVEVASGMVQAVYRGVQDARTCIRYFRKTVEEAGNPYGICHERIVLMGEGSGGIIALASATLDDYTDFLLPKFIGPDITGDGIPDPMVVPSIHGDLNGESLIGLHPFNGDTLALPNHPGHSSESQLCVNIGGVLLDTSWLDAGDPPILSFHVPNDPLLPYQLGFMINHPGSSILEVFGSWSVAWRADQLGTNLIFTDANIHDVFTDAANAHNEGYEGLFPFLRPCWINPFNNTSACESTPWAWWDATYWSQQPHTTCQLLGLPISECNRHSMALIHNQDMSAEKGRTYTDSIIGYFAPRAFHALALEGACFTQTEKAERGPALQVACYPNPAPGTVVFTSENGQPMLAIQLYNLSGQLMKNIARLDSTVQELDLAGLPRGIYIAKIQFAEGVLSKKISLE